MESNGKASSSVSDGEISLCRTLRVAERGDFDLRNIFYGRGSEQVDYASEKGGVTKRKLNAMVAYFVLRLREVLTCGLLTSRIPGTRSRVDFGLRRDAHANPRRRSG